LQRAIDSLDRRVAGTFTEGIVEEVDYENAVATVQAEGILTKEIPWLERAGDVVEWDPPSKGERVLLASPNGDLGRAMIMPGGYSNEVKQPHDKGGEFVRVTGDVRVEQTGSKLTITAGGVTVEISGDGMKINGGRVEHDSKNIGSTHVHGGIQRGGSKTDPPQ